MKRRYGDRMKQRILAKAAVELGPDILHCHDLMTLPAGQRARKLCGAKLIWDAHEIYEEVAQSDEAARQRNKKVLLANQVGIDAFITINDSIARFYAENYPALPPPLIIKNATVAIEPIRYDGRMHVAASLPLDQRIVLYQGGFSEKRGLYDLVAAAEYLDASWTLVMMGWGRLEDTLRELGDGILVRTRARRERPAVVFIPAVPQRELTNWTAGASLGVIPYEKIGLNHIYCTPNKLWEYPSADVPILCSPLVEMAKVINNNGVGWLLPDAAHPQAIADSVNSLTDEDLSKASAACRSYIAKDNWSVYESRLVDLYRSL